MLTKTDKNSIFRYEPKSFSEIMEYAKIIADSDLVPKDYKGKPGNVLVAIQMGEEVGLKPLQAVQGISVINGRPSVWGDTLLALIQAHPQCEYIDEEIHDDFTICRVKRKNKPLVERTFTIEDAKKASLWGKVGPWTTSPKRMLQMRARGFALRDSFADVLKGIQIIEEVLDYNESKTSVIEKKTNLQQLKDSLKEKEVDPEECHILENNPEIINHIENKIESSNLSKLIIESQIPSEIVNGWLEKAGVSSVEELPIEVSEKCEKYLIEKINQRKQKEDEKKPL